MYLINENEMDYTNYGVFLKQIINVTLNKNGCLFDSRYINPHILDYNNIKLNDVEKIFLIIEYVKLQLKVFFKKHTGTEKCVFTENNLYLLDKSRLFSCKQILIELYSKVSKLDTSTYWYKKNDLSIVLEQYIKTTCVCKYRVIKLIRDILTQLSDDTRTLDHLSDIHILCVNVLRHISEHH